MSDVGSLSQRPARARVESVDVLRGIVMILMALDHTRDFFGTADNPANPPTASAALFFTRWVTHLCAPTFFLLTGTGAYLARGRRSTADLSRFLVTRGLWLILLELTVVRCLGYQFNVDYRVTVLLILWALGWSMIVLGGLVWFTPRSVTAFGAALVLLHNLCDPVSAQTFGPLAPLWSILHAPGIVYPGPDHVVLVAYPLVPWIGVTALGYGLGQIFDWSAAARRGVLLALSSGLPLLFLVHRWSNVYGDPARWTVQATPWRTVLSFLNTTKYPPSLLFLCMTLGPAMLVLLTLDRGTPRLLRPALTFGRVPLFYFLLHFPLIHLLAVLVCYAVYGDAHWMFQSAQLSDFPFSRPPGWGFSLPVVYGIWISLVVSLYPLCRWFAAFKACRSDAWLSYL